ncbi:LysE family translocator [Ponticaulis profundi]|uniref:LysE family translocator n=1 Tax=Ponticaulis profundi TaxID=2665222 RepID=A0ABW1S999_9PROT
MELELWISLVTLFAAGGLTPGPAVMLVIASSLRYGMALSMAAAIGICVANMIWITLAASGAGVLANQFPTVFLGLKVAGLIFICWLAWKTATQPVSRHFEEDVVSVLGVNARKPPKYGRVVTLFFKGFGLQLANPNALVFFGGLLPAFFDVSTPIFAQAVVMILTVTMTELFGLTVYAGGARALAHQFDNPRFARIFYVCAGLVMALSVAWALIAQLL